MFDINNPKHKMAIDITKEELADMVDRYKRAATYKETKANGKPADISLKAMASLTASDATTNAFQEFENFLADITDTFDENVAKGDEHVYANMAFALQSMADIYTERAKSWAPQFKAHTVAFTDADKMNDADLAKLGKECSDTWRTLIGMVNQVKDRQSDASAKGLIEEITGQDCKIRNKESGIEFMLDIPRFRAPRTAKAKTGTNGTATSEAAAKTHLVLFVDGVRVEAPNFPEQCRVAFGWSSNDLMRRIADIAEKINEEEDNGKGRNWDKDTEYLILHDGNEYAVEIMSEETD